ncbi:MAG: glycine--tRNA ligase subunit beta [Armatimonadota bacterium]|nr:glycine--tRNA ligase subunit beta [Armatimonadota bacterium]MDR7438638.1 glycine--tRNA ligase subunit beta [Armatimonadota bacterium]MDR7562641.1 glycine--tRNA ligase subunit beta [Armatimonadota bacterium]MDR7567205.1 glycine--tRNA ligase subunit beta [Armatimonadota bacterium]MDR7602784.1 glycine--tRNA ligase subunit beta [Armatimonadota bacterium]
MPRLLVEIGVEEMPARFVLPALEQLEAGLRALLAEEGLGAGEVRTFGTPRRLVVIAPEVPERQEDAVREVRGPAVKVAYDVQGRPTQAALGFARSQGVAVDSLERRSTEAGEYVFARVRIPGRPTPEVLRERLPRLITGLSFPKTMRWGAHELRYGRPLRWIVAMLDDQVIAFEVAGVRSGRTTRGHRVLNPGPHAIPHAAEYERVVEEARVVVDHRRRAAQIREEVRRLAAEVGGEAIAPASLLEEVTFLVEHPTPFRGAFDPDFLRLPREILITVMQHHQRYFPVEREGRLLPYFIAVRDGDEVGLEQVREGNEWVLRARLEDARFFYEEDRKVPLAARLEQLGDMVFVERLGTVREKVERLRSLAAWLAAQLRLSEEERTHLVRAAELCKADLATHVVGEFPELAGTVGGLYARLDGEPEAVAEAIAEHLRPRTAEDTPPRSWLGALLGIADRADTLAGCLGIGLAPTGSADPYGLRRAASSLFEILCLHRVRIPLSALIRRALEGYPGLGDRLEEVWAFVLGRLRAWLLERGYTHDAVEAVLGVPWSSVADLVDRTEALIRFRATPAFAALYEAFDRAHRILDPALLSDGEPVAQNEAERDLLEAIRAVRPKVEAYVSSSRYEAALAELSGLRDPVARFFDAVFVNDPDPEVRRRRHLLLGEVVRLVRGIADLSRLAVAPGELGAE